MKNYNSIEKTFIRSVTHTVKEHGMLKENDTVLTAMSGGPDSVALLLSLMALKDTYNLKIGVVHVNHQLRGEYAQRDEDFSKAIAKKFDLPFHCRQTDVKEYADRNSLSIEAGGREVRYNYFKATALEHGYTKIATGHHKDDNVELVLMNLLRGSGPKGLSGIPPVRENHIVRPLIQVSKKEIQAFLSNQNQEYMTDDSNSDPQYLRNRIRHQLIPHLQSEYNPEITDALDRLSHILMQEENFWNEQTLKILTQCMISENTGTLVLSRHKISKFDPALLSRTFRMAIERVKKNLNRISHVHISSMMDFCFKTQSGISLDLPGRIRIYKTKDTITIKLEDRSLRDIGKEEKRLKRAAQKESDSK